MVDMEVKFLVREQCYVDGICRGKKYEEEYKRKELEVKEKL